MRLSYVLLFAAVALAGVLDTTSGVAVAKPNKANVVNAAESINRRFLRQQKYVEEDEEEDETEDENDDEDEDEGEFEERMWSGFTGAMGKAKQTISDKAALTSVAANFYGKNADEMGAVISKLQPSQIDTIFDKGADAIQKILPGFSANMGFSKFDDLIRGLPSEQQAVMISAYTKYLANKGML